MPTVRNQTILHQRYAKEHAHEAQHAVRALLVADRDCYREQALHHQSMARFHAERAWVGLLSLLLIDPII
jgi:hypothetical protein